MLTVSELIQMGFDEDEIREHGAPGQDQTLHPTDSTRPAFPSLASGFGQHSEGAFSGAQPDEGVG